MKKEFDLKIAKSVAMGGSLSLTTKSEKIVKALKGLVTYRFFAHPTVTYFENGEPEDFENNNFTKINVSWSIYNKDYEFKKPHNYYEKILFINIQIEDDFCYLYLEGEIGEIEKFFNIHLSNSRDLMVEFYKQINNFYSEIF